MEQTKLYVLPQLSFGYKDLEPYISEQQLMIHHQKHHQAYVTGANNTLQKMDKARKENTDFDVKATFKELSFNVSGHLLHSLFWQNLAPPSKSEQEPDGAIRESIEREFGGFARFKKEFSSAAQSVEGSGWAAISWCKETNRPLLTQIEKHNMNAYSSYRILMVLDVFEHAYYLDYKNDRAKFIEAFWKIVNWEGVNRRLHEIQK